MMFGVLIYCVYCANIGRGRHLHLAASFSALVLLKHLFVPMAPAFAVYLIRHHCFVTTTAPNNDNKSDTTITFSTTRFMQLVAIAVVALSIAIGPFIHREALLTTASEASSSWLKKYSLAASVQLGQMLTRLFPFGRGLVHAYWAPNVWAIYCFFDKVYSFSI